MLDLVHVMTELAQRRPAFHSEADFRDALARQIQECYRDAEVRPEYGLTDQQGPMHLDVWVTRLGNVAALELKYCTARARFAVGDKEFDLKDHSAQDLRRYDLLKDVSRLERTVRGRPSAVGYAILLTNDRLYWTEPQPGQRATIFEAFRVHEGSKVGGELAWSERAGEGTTKGRADPIRLAGSYTMVWRDYSSPTEEANGLFRYLLIEVGRDDSILDVGLRRPTEGFGVQGTLAGKILAEHLVEGELAVGQQVGLRIDQTLTQDVTGTMAFLQYEALVAGRSSEEGEDRVRTEVSVSYVDHNTLQSGPENANDHRYLQSAAARYGVHFSRPGNGICHQVHLERFGVPGKTLLGSDSHTPTAGGLGMLGIGAGGLDVAAAMAGQPFYLACPSVVGVRLTGQLRGWASAKDVILELLRRLSVKGGVGKLMEYFGPGAASLSVPERATITNMGAELGATSSLFPSDGRTRQFLALQRREEQWVALSADEDADYEEIIALDLAELEPLVAQPHMPDRVVPLSELAGLKVDQVCIGSCTNSSLADLMVVAEVLRGRRVHPDVSLAISPGSRQVLIEATRLGLVEVFLAAGARMLEPACGPCIGVGQSPASGAVSVRTFNRNFAGRSGTPDARVYLAGPAVAAWAAVTGELRRLEEVGEAPRVELPEEMVIDDSMILPPPPAEKARKVPVVMGPTLAPLPTRGELDDELVGEVILVVGDNITTDDIIPAGTQVLALRSNIPAISEHVFSRMDPGFAARARAAGVSFVVGGENYGQGSSREHAALAPMYLGVRAVLARSFARIHWQNLINFGVVPLRIDEEAYGGLKQGARLHMTHLRAGVRAGEVRVVDEGSGRAFTAKVEADEGQVEVLLAGGRLNYLRARLD